MKILIAYIEIYCWVYVIIT